MGEGVGLEQPGDHIRFSVVVPAYNEAAYLGRALDSLQHQDYGGTYEIIVVDNNSTDSTADIAARHGVRVVREPQQGVCAARQRGADCARGEIIISTDADSEPNSFPFTINVPTETFPFTFGELSLPRMFPLNASWPPNSIP